VRQHALVVPALAKLESAGNNVHTANLKVHELKAVLTSMQQDTSGHKPELVARLQTLVGPPTQVGDQGQAPPVPADVQPSEAEVAP
jgi:hypothetical protein